MSNVLFLSVPSHGHVNPTIGLVSELVKQGETVTYFASEEFRGKIEKTGATFRSYTHDLDMFKAPPKNSRKLSQPDPGDVSGAYPAEPLSPMFRIIQSGRAVIEDILTQIEDQTFDYIVHSAPFLFAKPMAQILNLPTVSSLAVFAGLGNFFQEAENPGNDFFAQDPRLSAVYQQAAQDIVDAYGVKMPESALGLIFNKGDLNLVYTSAYFAANITYFDETFKFVGPPVYDRQEQVDFPFEKLAGKKVLYISLGTVFGGHSPRLYDVFFQSFADWDGIVVLAAYNVDQSTFDVPDNFLVRNYVPQGEILKYATAAITHAGMNSINDLLSNEIPFVCLPMGADQPLLAARAQELGATIVLDVNTVEPEELRKAVEAVMQEPSYRTHMRTISDSFKLAGGYSEAVKEIFGLAAFKLNRINSKPETVS